MWLLPGGLEGLFQFGDTFESWSGFQRFTDCAGLGQRRPSVVQTIFGDAQAGDLQQRQGPFKGSGARLRQFQRLRQVLLGSIEFCGFGVELAQKTVDGDQCEWLTWIAGVGQRLFGLLAGELRISLGMVVLRPTECTFGPAQDGAGPLQPAIMGFEPVAGRWKIVRIEGEFSCKELQWQDRREVGGARFSPRAGRQDSSVANATDPGGIRIELFEFGPDSLQGKAIDSWK